MIKETYYIHPNFNETVFYPMKGENTRTDTKVLMSKQDFNRLHEIYNEVVEINKRIEFNILKTIR